MELHQLHTIISCKQLHWVQIRPGNKILTFFSLAKIEVIFEVAWIPAWNELHRQAHSVHAHDDFKLPLCTTCNYSHQLAKFELKWMDTSQVVFALVPLPKVKFSKTGRKKFSATQLKQMKSILYNWQWHLYPTYKVSHFLVQRFSCYVRLYFHFWSKIVTETAFWHSCPPTQTPSLAIAVDSFVFCYLRCATGL